MNFTFQPQWKEELVCTCPLGQFILEMPMGIPSVYLPSESAWQDHAPDWAKPYWKVLREQLAAWCAKCDYPLYENHAAQVFVVR
jgi:hypothetical protein